MRRILIILGLASIVFLMCCPKPHGRIVVLGGGQFTFSEMESGNIKGVGGGMFGHFGAELNPNQYPRLIGWIKYDAPKSQDGISADEVNGGISYLTEQLVKPVRMGAFFSGGAGAGKIEEDPVTFSSLTEIGLYFDLTDRTQLQFGVGASNVGTYTTYALKLGLALYR